MNIAFNSLKGASKLCSIFIIFLSVSLVSTHTFAKHHKTSLIQTYTRDTVSLDGDWKYFIDPYLSGYKNYHNVIFENEKIISKWGFFTDSKVDNSTELLEYNFDTAKSLKVPSDWNTQAKELLYYEGSVWYRKKFDSPHHYKNLAKRTKKNDRIFLHFGAVNYQADVYLNGKKLGVHKGGFTPFQYEITGKIKDKNNSLVVKVDNTRYPHAIPTHNTDWWNYGGITRSVKIAVVPQKFIRDYTIKLDSHITKNISGSVFIDNIEKNESYKKGIKVDIYIPELKIKKTVRTNRKGKATFSFKAPNISLWSPKKPKRYEIQIRTRHDTLVDKVGFRTISTHNKDILLNGRKIFLKGISIHEEYAADGGGRVKSATEARQLLTWAKELNSNFVRLAHYPHNEHMARIAEEMGILVWAEIPVYWVIEWTNPDTYQNAESQLTTLIERDKNRAAVIIWSVANETPISPERTTFITNLVNKARELDNTRLISAALLHQYNYDGFDAKVEDPLSEALDIVSFNQYVGWYNGLPDKANKTTWEIKYNKPIFVSEFGGGAKFGYHGDASVRWTEEFQELLYKNTLNMLDKIDGFSGTSPWILTDFRSPKRILPGIQDGFNRKGVLSEKGEKKKAFYVLKEYYKNK